MTKQELEEQAKKKRQEYLDLLKQIKEFDNKYKKINILIYDSSGNKLDDSKNTNIITYYANYTYNFMLAPCILCQDNINSNIKYKANLTIDSRHPYYPNSGHSYWRGDVDFAKSQTSTGALVSAYNGTAPTGITLNFRNAIIYNE